MASNQDTGSKSRVGARIPNNQKEALFLLAKKRSQERREEVSQAEIIREYIEEGLNRESGLPSEAREVLGQRIASDGYTSEEDAQK